MVLKCLYNLLIVWILNVKLIALIWWHWNMFYNVIFIMFSVIRAVNLLGHSIITVIKKCEKTIFTFQENTEKSFEKNNKK